MTEIIIGLVGLGGLFILGVGCGLVTDALLAFPVMWFWNIVVTQFFAVHSCTYLQAFLMTFVVTMVCGLLGRGSSN